MDNAELSSKFEALLKNIKKPYDEFIEKSKIDLTDLSFFDIDEVDEFEEKTKAVSFVCL